LELQVQTILEKYSSLVEWVSGEKAVVINDVADPTRAKIGSLVFIGDKKYLEEALESKASTLVMHKSLVAAHPVIGKTVLSTSNPPLLMARLLKDYFPVQQLKAKFEGHRIHPTAVIAKTAEIAESAVVGPFAVISEHCRIGANTVIGGHCFISMHAQIGDDCHLHPHVFVAHDVVIQNRVEIQPQSCIGAEGFGYAHDEKGRHERIHHYGRVVIENDVHIGAGVQIGKFCLIAGGTLFAGSSSIGNHVVVGGSVNLAGHIHVADHTQIAGFSTLGKSVDQPGAYQGYPLQPLTEHKRTMAALLTLPALRKDVLRILKKLNLKE
jgi:UDP-3-O-[3-hydroxymyristoyl] glucosamine N-acyltransferase